ncbi:hypothetical protein [Halorhodospira abdelmalekii]|uniref:hypothetical protein n=1 Tax=Halorhodospira abdelmalekii TaxID=421629 RepID=UPI001905F123|nr:hypothetical protein [Halorhodospira abdelmalekii]
MLGVVVDGHVTVTDPAAVRGSVDVTGVLGGARVDPRLGIGPEPVPGLAQCLVPKRPLEPDVFPVIRGGGGGFRSGTKGRRLVTLLVAAIAAVEAL